MLHYLPKKIFDKILKVLRNPYPGKLINLLGESDIKKLLKESNIRNYRIIRNRILGFTIDFAIIF